MIPPNTIGELLFQSYANLAMAHAALDKGETAYSRVHYAIRAKLYKGLCNDTMNIGSLADDERVKMKSDKACCYCGATDKLSLDHLVASSIGGSESADNLVWACRSCNSSKGTKDLLVWFQSRNEFPPLFLLRRYLKIAIEWVREKGLVDEPIQDHDEDAIPFAISAIPLEFPDLSKLRMSISSSICEE